MNAFSGSPTVPEYTGEINKPAGSVANLASGFSPIGTALTLGSLAASAFGLGKSAKLNRERQKRINDRRTMSDAWFNQEYYRDLTQNPAARSALQLIKDKIKENQTKTASTAAITGATDESQLAAQAVQENAFDETVKGLAENEQARKDTVRAEKVQQDNILDQQQSQIDAEKFQSNANLLNNAVSLGQTALGANFKPVDDRIKKLLGVP